MNSIHHGWSLDEIAPEARRAAERAAEAAGMPLEIWLNQLIKYVSAMELSGKGPARARAIDETIKRAAAEQARMGPVDGPTDGTLGTPMMLESAPTEYPTTLPAEMLEPNRFAEEQPGERDIEQAIGEWRKSGSLAPLVVRPDTRRPGYYEIVNGMERWHAASRLHMRRIPVTVRELTDEEVLRATLIQKLALKSLPPLDEAQIYQRLMEETGLSVAALSDVIGRSPTHVATALQLLDLPQPVREMINSGELSVLHARTLLGAADPEPAAREVVNRRLDIYQTEQLVRASHGALTPPSPAPAKPQASEAIGEAAQTVAAPAPVTPAAVDAPVMERTLAAQFTNHKASPATPAQREPIFEDTGLAGELPEPIEPEPIELEPIEPEPIENAPYAASGSAFSDPGAHETHPASSEFVAVETDAAASDALDTGSPMLLGTADTRGAGILASTSGEGDADALIEASPAIDSPGIDSPASDALTLDNSVTDNPEKEEVALGDPAVPFMAAATSVDPEPTTNEYTPPLATEPQADTAGDLPAEPIGTGDDLSVDSASNISAGSVSDTAVAAKFDPPAFASDANGGEAPPNAAEPADDSGVDDSTRMVETHLSTLLGLKVSIAERNQDDGVLSIHYNSENELTDLVSRLNRMPTGRRAE